MDAVSAAENENPADELPALLGLTRYVPRPPVFRPDGVPISEEAALLRKRVLRQVEDDPARFDMSTWDSALLGEPECGSTRCRAGWALHLSGDPVRHGEEPVDIERRAIAALELTCAEFYGSGFPYPLFFQPEHLAVSRFRECPR